jgi:hemoglobin-like flavoprotein
MRLPGRSAWRGRAAILAAENPTEIPMTPAQQHLLRTSWSAVEPIADEAATMFYTRLFELDPGLRKHFGYTDMERQRALLMQMLGVVVRHIDRLDEIMPEVEALGRRHAGYRVEPEHYTAVGSALLWTLEQGLGDDFTQETAYAWADAYRRVSSAMIAAAQQVESSPIRPRFRRRRRWRGSASLPLGWQMGSAST